MRRPWWFASPRVWAFALYWNHWVVPRTRRKLGVERLEREESNTESERDK